MPIIASEYWTRRDESGFAKEEIEVHDVAEGQLSTGPPANSIAI